MASTVPEMAKVVSARYRTSKNAGHKTNFTGIVLEVVKENGYRGAEIPRKMSEVIKEVNRHRSRWVRSWGRKAS